jgi:hypothetical protein
LYLGGDAPEPYRTERAAEVQSLCDPRVLASIADLGIEVGSFSEAETFLAGSCTFGDES